MKLKAYLIGALGMSTLMAGVPLVTAFEGHQVNVTSYVKQPIVSGKTFAAVVTNMDLDGDTDIDCDGVNDTGPTGDLANNLPTAGVANDSCVNTSGFIKAPDVVRTFQRVCWDVFLNVTNDTTATTMTQVVARDRFSAELNGEALGALPIELHKVSYNKGKGKNTKSNSALEVLWWVDYDPVVDWINDDAFVLAGSDYVIDDYDYNFRTPAPGSTAFNYGETATAHLYVCTKLNPALKQEYTSPGCYNFNSGITVKWLQDPGPGEPVSNEDVLYQMSLEGNKLWVWASDVPLDPTNLPGPVLSCIEPNP